MTEIIALLVGIGAFIAIMVRRQNNSDMDALEWELNHVIRAPCRNCEETVVLDQSTVPGIWKHLRTGYVVSQTPYGQPHDAFPWPFSTEKLEAMGAYADEEDDLYGDLPDLPPIVTTVGSGPRPVAR